MEASNDEEGGRAGGQAEQVGEAHGWLGAFRQEPAYVLR